MVVVSIGICRTQQLRGAAFCGPSTVVSNA
jgi:hypothetical protein